MRRIALYEYVNNIIAGPTAALSFTWRPGLLASAENRPLHYIARLIEEGIDQLLKHRKV